MFRCASRSEAATPISGVHISQNARESLGDRAKLSLQQSSVSRLACLES
jgi:hypothetical protein